MADHKIKFYVIDGVKIGIAVGMGPTRINTILQSAFFKLANIIPESQAIDLMKKAAAATYGRKGRMSSRRTSGYRRRRKAGT